MRLTTVILIASLMQVSAAGFAQKISLSKSNASLKTVLREIKAKAGYNFIYRDKILEKAKPVTINVNQAEVEDVLKQIFEKQELSYSIDSKTVIIQPKEPSFLDRVKSVFVDTDVRGRIVDEQGNPMPNASIQVKGKSQVYKSNEKGEFSIPNVADDAILVIRYVGYRQLEVKLSEAIMPLEIKLNIATGELEEVKIVYDDGYQKLNKERSTGSFVQLSNKNINRIVSTNILERIFNITNGLRKAADFSSQSNVSIRGLSTINANRKPLIVIDGFPYEDEAQFGNFNVKNINPNDVESITVLKDAAAASIWGARSANGVIVITTKKGKFNQKPVVQMNSSVNITERQNLLKADIMSSADVVDYEKRLFNSGVFNINDDQYPSLKIFPVVSPVIEILLAKRRGEISNEQAEAKISLLKEHDVRNDILKYMLQTSVNQQYNVNVSGGSDKMTYYSSIGYDKNLGNDIGTKSNRVTLNFNNTYRPFRKLEINSYIFYTQSKSQKAPMVPLRYIANGINPTAAPYSMLADEWGNPLSVPLLNQLREKYIDTIRTSGLLDWHYRPLDEIHASDNQIKDFSVRAGGKLGYAIIKGLSFSLSGQYERRLNNTDNYYSIKTYQTRDLINRYMFLDATGKPQYPVPLGGILDYGNSTTTNYNLRGQINLNRSFSSHTISAIIGADVSQGDQSLNSNRKYGYDPNTLAYSTNMDYKNVYAVRPQLNSSVIAESSSLTGTVNRFLSYYGNAGYTFLNKYTLTASARMDASNFFGIEANLKWAPLWSVGSSWDISKEEFFKSKVFSSLKVRATYGYNGNLDNTISSLPVATIRTGNSIYNNLQSFAVVGLGNPNLTWEKVNMRNIAVDFSLLNNRLSGSLEYYTKKVNNLIGPVLPDPTTGSIEYKGNGAGLKSKGLDLNLSGILINRRVKVQSTFNISFNKDEVTEYYFDPEFLKNASVYFGQGGYIVGKPVNKMYSYKWAGLNPLTGDPMGIVNGQVVPFSYAIGSDINGFSNTKPEDLVYHGRGTPPVFGNMLNTISYKQFSFSFNCIYSLGYYFRKQTINYNNIQTNWGGHSDYKLRWQHPGDELTTTVPSLPITLDTRYSFYSQSEVLVERGDHIYLQDAALQYQVNGKIPLSVTINVQNVGLLWRANKKGIDPTDVTGSNIPRPRSIALSLNLKF